MSQAPEPTSLDRVGRIRRMLEDGQDDPTLFAPNYINKAPWDIAVQRKENNADAKFDAPRVFSDLRVIVEQALETGDTVTVHWRMHGTWSGPLPFAPGIPPTGKEVEFTGTHLYRFEGDQIVEKDGEFDVKAASKALLGGLNITCGSDDCFDVVQSLSRNASLPVAKA